MMCSGGQDAVLNDCVHWGRHAPTQHFGVSRFAQSYCLHGRLVAVRAQYFQSTSSWWDGRLHAVSDHARLAMCATQAA